MPMRGRWIAALAAAAAAARAGAAPAGAVEDLHPTATISIDLGGKARECVAGKCGNYGGRTAAVKWASSCNETNPALDHGTFVTLMARPKKAGAKLVVYDSVFEGEGGDGATGSDVVVIPAGVHLFAKVAVECSYTADDAEGNSVTHTGTTSANTADVFLKPALTGFNMPRNNFCGVNVPNSKINTTAQAGQFAVLDYSLRFSPLSMLTRTTLTGLIDGVRLYGRGAGLNFKKKPIRSALRKGEYEAFIKPKRGGTLKIWATIGGVKTNVRAIKVYPKRC